MCCWPGCQVTLSQPCTAPAGPETADRPLGDLHPQLSVQSARARGAQQIRDDHRESENMVWTWFGAAHPGPTSTIPLLRPSHTLSSSSPMELGLLLFLSFVPGLVSQLSSGASPCGEGWADPCLCSLRLHSC